MTRDVLALLREANPVKEASRYSPAQLNGRIEDALAADVPTTISIELGRHPYRPRGRALPILVAAVVLVVASVVSLVIVGTGDRHQNPALVDPGTQVVCSIHPAGGVPTAAQLKLAQQTISSRARALGASTVSFAMSSGDGQIAFTPKGISANAAAKACDPVTAQIRPLLGPPVPHASAGSLFTGLPLAVALPETAAQYAQLTARQLGQLTTAMSHYNCAPAAGQEDGSTLSCDGTSSAVYVLGSTLISGEGLVSATANAPGVSSNGLWTVELHLNTGAQTALANYTGAHHSASGATAAAQDCGPATVPCADYLAVVIDGAVALAPPNLAPIRGDLELGGNLAQATATGLADQFSAAALGLRLVSVPASNATPAPTSS